MLTVALYPLALVQYTVGVLESLYIETVGEDEKMLLLYRNGIDRSDESHDLEQGSVAV